MSEAPLASIDGRIVAGAEATVPVTDRGFLYGDSIFETFRTYEGRPHALDRHLARLRRSAEAVQIRLPLDEDEFRREIAELIAQSEGERRVRLVVTRGDAVGLYEDGVRRVILSFPFQSHPSERYDPGVACRTVQGARDMASAKAGSYILSVLATREAHAAGAHEAILMDGELVREGATSNVFIVDPQGRLRTSAAGVLAGVTRSIVLELARDVGIEVDEGRVDREALFEAREVFLTSATREVMAVRKVDDRVLESPGALTQQLLAAYRQSIPTRLAPT